MAVGGDDLLTWNIQLTRKSFMVTLTPIWLQFRVWRQ